MEMTVDTMDQMGCAGLTLEKDHKVSKGYRDFKVTRDFKGRMASLLELLGLFLTLMLFHPLIQTLI
jgi:hypothetical protein